MRSLLPSVARGLLGPQGPGMGSGGTRAGLRRPGEGPRLGRAQEKDPGPLAPAWVPRSSGYNAAVRRGTGSEL